MYATGDVPFILDVRKGTIDAAPELAAALEFPCPDEGIPLEAFLTAVVPEERKRLEHELRQSGIVLEKLRLASDQIGLLLAASRMEEGGPQVRGLLTAEEKDLFRPTGGVEDSGTDVLSHIISHDLRAPLRGVTGFGQMLKEHEGKVLGKEEMDLLQRMLGEAERLNQMLIALTRFSRIATQPPAPVQLDLAAECAAVWKDMHSEHRGKLHIVSEAGVRADATLTRTLLKELLANSLQFSQEGKELQVTFFTREVEGGVVCALVDNGIGFDMRYASKLFTPFQKMHSADVSTGMGMGLAIAAKIAEKHGGRTWIASKEGAGTTLLFTMRSP